MSSDIDTLGAALPADPPGAAPAGPWAPVRRLGPQHRGRIQAHLLGLSAEDRALRFGHAASDERIVRYAQGLDFERDELLGVFNRRLQLAGLAHLAYPAAPNDEIAELTAEFAVSVSERSQGKGLGSHLFDHAVTHARNRGVQRLLIHLARDNAAMQAIVRRAGAELSFDGADALATLPLPTETLGSLVQELVQEQAAAMDYRLKLNVLRIKQALPSAIV